MNMEPANAIRIGTAGWTVPAASREAFAKAGTHLERYAVNFGAVEINSSFHRSHRLSTYQRWAAVVPDKFRFSVKVPKEITHLHRLVGVEKLLDGFLAEIAGLEGKLGPLLVQLPPRFAFDLPIAERFLTDLRDRTSGPVALEPRNASWFFDEAETLLSSFQIGRVKADPAPVPQAERSGGWAGLRYLRLHGSPRIYHSSYPDDLIRSALDPLRTAAAAGSECWCIFDNTASGAATGNAQSAQSVLVRGRAHSDGTRYGDNME